MCASELSTITQFYPIIRRAASLYFALAGEPVINGAESERGALRAPVICGDSTGCEFFSHQITQIRAPVVAESQIQRRNIDISLRIFILRHTVFRFSTF